MFCAHYGIFRWLPVRMALVVKLIHFIYTSGLLKVRGSMHFFMLCVISRVTALTNKLINHLPNHVQLSKHVLPSVKH